MSMLLIIVAIAFTVAMTILMIRPFSTSRREQLSFELLDEEERQIESLVSRKVALVQALQDIEYDWETDKISEEDYRRFKKSCERQAVGVMRKLDNLHGEDRDWETVIDRAVAERLDTASVDDIRQGRENRRSSPTPSSDDTDHTRACPSCEASLEHDDRFCSQCGTAVDADESLGANTPDELDSLSSSSPPEVAG